MLKIMLVVGARPNFMKIFPLVEEIKKYPQIKPLLVHTGQHYDSQMSKVFFDDLGLPEPDIYLGIGSGSHAEQTANIMIEIEKVLLYEKPDLVLVVGDVNSTLAASIVAVKLLIPVAHVEAGLRSFDREMPEEINRLLTDVISDYLFTTSQDADENLKKEGISQEKIFFVGNTMIDSLQRLKNKANDSIILQRLKLKEKDFAILTLHRPSNVDRDEDLSNILDIMEQIQQRIKIVFPAHPRTQKQLKSQEFYHKLKKIPGLIIINPLSYLDFMKLMIESKFVLTDSGGIQEETTVLNIPCLTLRESTERPITVTLGTNVIVGTNSDKIIKECLRILDGYQKQGVIPPLWDGKAASRIVQVLLNEMGLL